MSRVSFALVLLLAGCDEKPAAPPQAPAATFGAVLEREAAELRRLESEHHNEQQQVRALGEEPLAARLNEGLGVERDSLGRAHKTLGTARVLVADGRPSSEADARARLDRAMTEVRALRRENEALWTTLQAELARRAPPEEAEKRGEKEDDGSGEKKKEQEEKKTEQPEERTPEP